MTNKKREDLAHYIKKMEKEQFGSYYILQKIADNYPHSYLSIIEKDLSIGFTAGQEFKKQNLDPFKFIGLSLKQVFGEHEPFVRKHYLKTFEGKEQTFELFVNDQYQEYKTVPLINEDGSIDRILVVVENVTEKKIAIQQLEESEKKHRLFFDHAPLAYQSLDENGNILDVNKAWLELLGYKLEEVEGKWFGEFLHPEQKEIFKKLFPENIKRKDIIRDVEFHLQKKNGKFIIVRYTAKIGFDNEGNFVRTHCLFEDITEKTKAEEELKNSEEKLKQHLTELEIFNDASVDRELMINDLRKEINDLLKELGRKPKYEIVE